MTALAVVCGIEQPARARSTPPPAADQHRYANELVQKARHLRLADDVMWQRLLHYRKTLFGGWESEADGKPFFLAADGKTNPEAELTRTLLGFFSPVTHKTEPRHPLCRFPARFMWLDSKLGIDRKKLPRQQCPEFEEFVKLLAPRSLVLVFSSYYLNNPASAFGHTFLRVSKSPPGGDRKGLSLLDYGVDYSATADTGNAVLYAFKGLTGLFRGDFHRIPYYYKVREYNDFESRDLWEYELDLDSEQVLKVVSHVWELGHTYFAYYYLTENCSYHILALLETADPKLHLVDKLGWPVIPADTVKPLQRNPGLIRQVSYRPSNRTRFAQLVDMLTPEEQRAVQDLMNDAAAPLPAEFSVDQKVRVLDVAVELMDVRTASDLPKARSEMDADNANMQQALLERRTEFLVPSPEYEFAPPFRQMPHIGHDSARVGLGSGHDRNDGYYHTLNFRLALHDMADPATGYPDAAEIQFLPGSLRYFIEDPRVRLESLSLIRVRSFTPLSRFEDALSWMIDTGADRSFDSGCNGCLSLFGQIGAGLTLQPFGSFLTMFALANAKIQAPVDSGLLDTIRVGVGPWGGLRLRFAEQVTLLGTGGWSYLPGQEPFQTWNVDGTLRVGYSKNFALGVEGQLFPSTMTLQGVSYIYF
jgi:hypothetical protein